MLEKKIAQSSLKKSEASAEEQKKQRELPNSLNLSIVTQFHPPDYAATGQLIAELASQLSILGVHVSVFTGQPVYASNENFALKRETLDQVSVQRSRTSKIWPSRIRGRALNGLFFTLRAGLHILKHGHQGTLLLTTEPPYLPILGYIANLVFGIPYICLLYDLYPDVAVELKVISRRHWVTTFWDSLNRRAWKKADHIIVLSSTMKERITAKCPEIKDKIAVIHSWANSDQIRPLEKQKNWFAHQFNLVNQFTVLYSGNMGRCHDIDTIVAAIAELKDEPIQFVFIGHGAKRTVCLEQLEELGVTNYQFLPYQDKAVLPYSLTACDLSLVSIEKGLEGLVAPSKLYGILAAGKPVAAVCESHSYLRKLLHRADCGKAFDNGDSKGLADFIRSLAADSRYAKRLGESGRQYLISNFTPEVIAQEYLKVLQK